LTTELTRGTSDEALVALIVEEFHKKRRRYLGRTAIQKLCYFAQALGLPLTHHFKVYYYGPFSDELSAAIDMLLASGVLKDASNDPRQYSNFKLGPRAVEVLSAQQETVNKYRPTVERVTSALGKLSPQALELLSTLHFIDRRLKAGGASSPSKEVVIKDFRQVKAEKFSNDQINDAYKAMRQAGLIA
jgi:uncharacterized protein YwgA